MQFEENIFLKWHFGLWHNKLSYFPTHLLVFCSGEVGVTLSSKYSIHNRLDHQNKQKPWKEEYFIFCDKYSHESPAQRSSSAKGYLISSGMMPVMVALSSNSLTSVIMWIITVESRTPPPKHKTIPAWNIQECSVLHGAEARIGFGKSYL